MPRHARFVIPGVPHHITQRGNHRATVFFDTGDYLAYLHLLGEQSRDHDVSLVAYCLMPNHVHLIAVPKAADGLHRLLRDVHGRFAQRINRMKERTGHLWQARYFSSPLDALYFVRAVRYVELNPVRAGLAGRAEEYPWSSAELHCQGRCSALLAPVEGFEQLNGIANWSKWLRNGLDDSTLATLRRNISQNLPCGTDEFIHRLEATAGRPLRYKPQGREAEMKRDSHPER